MMIDLETEQRQRWVRDPSQLEHEVKLKAAKQWLGERHCLNSQFSPKRKPARPAFWQRVAAYLEGTKCHEH